MRFNAIDVNGDQKIDLQEAVRFVNTKGVERRMFDSTPRWFAEMDEDKSGFIEPKEFDGDVTEENISILFLENAE